MTENVHFLSTQKLSAVPCRYFRGELTLVPFVTNLLTITSHIKWAKSTENHKHRLLTQ